MKNKNTNKPKLLLRAIAMVIAVVLLCAGGVLQVAADAVGLLAATAKASDPVPTVGITKVTYKASGAVIRITLTNAEAGVNYTVYYRTSNGSAVAGKEFYKVDSSVVMTSKSTTADVFVQYTTAQDAYGIASFKGHNGTTYSGTKHFIFEVYYAESTGDTIYPAATGNTDSTVSINSSQANTKVNTTAPATKMGISYSGGVAYLSNSMWTTFGSVLWATKQNSDYDAGKGVLESSFSYSKSNMTSYTSGSSNLSDPIFGYYIIPETHSGYFADKSTTYLGGNFVTEVSISGGSGNTYAAIYNAKIAGGDVVTAGLRAKSAIGYSTIKAAQSGADMMETLFSDGDYYTTLNGKNAVRIEDGVAFMYFYKVNLATGTVKVKSTSMAYTYYDNTSPVISDYYVQSGTYGAGQTIRLAITFSELVRVRNYSAAPYLVFTMESSISGASSSECLTFKYAGGDGTDTLYFEAVVPSGTASSYINITDLKKCTMGRYYFDNVVDLAYNATEYSSAVVKSNNGSTRLNNSSLYKLSAYGRATTLTVDTRPASITRGSIQEIDANGSKTTYTYNTTPSASVYGVDVNLTFTNVANGSTIYYAWMSGYNATPYPSRSDYQTIKVSSGGVTINATGLTTGRYTLCVLYVSPGFVRTTARYNFYFDSAKPEVTLSGVSGYNTFTTGTHGFTIEGKDDSLTRIAKTEYALSTASNETEATLAAKNLFVDIGAAATSIKETVTVGKTAAGVVTTGLNPSAAGKYYVYVRLTDGNGLKVVKRSDFTLAFDFRSADEIAQAFNCTLTGGGDASADTMLQGALTEEFGNIFFQNANLQWNYDEATTWSISLKHNGTTLFTETLASSGDVGKQPKYLQMAGNNYCVKFEENGYYELTLSYTGGGTTFEFKQEVYIYGVGGVYAGDNYDTLMGEFRYVKTKYWQLLRSSYTQRQSDNTVKNIAFTPGSESILPVFVDYESAYNYVRLLEIQDVAQVTLTQANVNTINSGGQLVADNVEPRVGDTWYYYKSPGGTDSNSYRWYYYGLDEPTSNLSQALHKNILRIVGSQTDSDYPNDYYYAAYDKVLNSDGGNIFLSTDKTMANPNMYESIVTIGTETAMLISDYTVNNAGGKKLFARPHASDNNYNEMTGAIGDELVTGLYEMVEIGPRGAIKFLAYIDNTAPYLDLNITNGADETMFYNDITGTASATIYGKELVISAMKGEIDPWAVLSIVKANGATVSMTLAEFNENGGYTIAESGTYTVYAFDRSGNVTMFTVMLKTEGITLSAPTRAEARNYNFAVTNRIKSEISALTIRYNGEVQTVDTLGNSLTQLNQLSFTFGYSGTYRVDISDRYGYTFSEEYELEKPLPAFTLAVDVEGNGRYVNCTEESGFMQISENGRTYTVFTSSPLRILYLDQNYTLTWLMEPAEGTYKYNGFVGSSYRHSFTQDAKDWICVISYDSDPYSSITIVSLADETPPYVSAIATKGENEVSVVNESKVPADRIAISWNDDDSLVTKVTYTFNGGAPIALDASAGGALIPTADAEGVYQFIVTNVVGLSQTITFTVDNTIDMTAVSGDQVYDLTDGPVIYENEDVRLFFKENVELYITCDHYPAMFDTIFELFFSYSETAGITALFIAGEMQGEPMEFSPEFLDSIANGSVASAPVGTNMFDCLEALQEFFITIGKTAEGEIYLSFAITESESDERAFSLAIEEQGAFATVDFRLSKQTSDIVVLDEENETLAFNSSGALSVNEEVSLLGQLQALDIIADISYVVDGQGEPISLYKGEGTLFTDTIFTEDGDYVISIRNRYGNVTVRTIKIYRSIRFDTTLNYADGSTVRVYNNVLTTNGSVTFIGSTASTYTLTSDGAALPNSFVFALDDLQENYVLTISQIGEYHFTVTDSFGNSLSYHVTVVAPEEKKTDDKNSLLSGWKTEALRGDENYTCEKLSFADGWNTAYVVYAYYAGLSLDDLATLNRTTGKIVVVRDLLSLTQIDRYDDLKIGDDGDGLYVISFYDGNGNRILLGGEDTVTVSYKGSTQFALSREVDGREEEAYSMSTAIADGFWSNNSLFFTITAKEYRFTINGESVTADDVGRYAIVRKNEETDVVYDVAYADDYGNAYAFTAHILKKSPHIYYADTSIVITLDMVAYVKGSPAFTSDALGGYAYYTKGDDSSVLYTPGENITGDGAYILTFADIAGNTNEVRFTIDTKVDWKITIGQIGSETLLFNGAASNNSIKLSRSGSEIITVVAATRNGVDVLSSYQNAAGSYIFDEDGAYDLTIADRVGNTDTVSFTVVSAPRQNFTYTTPEDWFVSALSYLSGGVNVYVTDTEFLSEDNRQVTLNGDRVWTVYLTKRDTGVSYSFTVTADNTAPVADFTGLAEHVKGEVVLTGVDSDGIAEIYLNGTRVSSTRTTAGTKLSLSVSEPGDYRIVVTDMAGNAAEYTFTVDFVLNAFSIVAIVFVGLILLVLAFFALRMRRTIRVR